MRRGMVSHKNGIMTKSTNEDLWLKMGYTKRSSGGGGKLKPDYNYIIVLCRHARM